VSLNKQQSKISSSKIYMNSRMSHFSLKSLLGAVLMVVCFAFNLNAQDGQKLFKQNCAVCHNSHTDAKSTGPGLKGVFDRVPKGDWIHKWIINNEKMIKSGDPYANKIFNENGKAAMTVFEGVIDDKGVDAIVAFLKGPAPVEPGAAAATGGGAAGPEDGEQNAGIDILYLILGSIVILVILIGALRSVRTALANTANRNEGKPENPDITFWEEVRQMMSGHRRLVGVFCIIIGFIGMKSCWDACYNIGVYYDWHTHKGYKPEQPIKFSHKIHAGDNEIACQYCHNTVEKSRHAGIPSVNVCMNCHKGISKTVNKGSEEQIAKIYYAAGFNTKTSAYDFPQNPLKWIKVHNLPDHVYFNHSQHVVAGKQECATCHGDVKSMTVAEQKKSVDHEMVYRLSPQH